MKMRIFGRERQSLRIKKIKGSRAVYVHPGNAETNEVEIRMVTEDGERLDLQVPSRLIPELLRDLRISYEAIVPPLYSGGWNSRQQGMDI